MAKVTTYLSETGILRSARKYFWAYLIGSLILGAYSGLLSAEYTCKHTVLVCRFSFGDYVLAALLSALIYVVLIGLPLGYIMYQDEKWSMYGYKSKNGIFASIFSIWVVLTAVYPDFFRWLNSSTYPFFTIVGIIIIIAYIIWIIISAVYYHRLKEQYENDKKNGKLPKASIAKALKNKEESRIFIEKERKIDITRKTETEEDDYYDGL